MTTARPRTIATTIGNATLEYVPKLAYGLATASVTLVKTSTTAIATGYAGTGNACLYLAQLAGRKATPPLLLRLRLAGPAPTIQYLRRLRRLRTVQTATDYLPQQQLGSALQFPSL